MAELTREQQKALALARARLKTQEFGVQGRRGQNKPLRDEGSFALKGFTELVNAPFDITDFVLRKIGLPKILPKSGPFAMETEEGEPIPAMNLPKEVLEAVGFDVAEREPRTTGEYMAQTIGEGVAGIIPVLRVAKGLQAAGAARTAAGKVPSVAQGVGETIMREATEKPLRFLGMETAAAAGAGIGRQQAEERDLGPAGSIAAELAGGLGASMVPAATRAATRTVGRTAMKSPLIGPIARTALGYTDEGAFQRASRRMRALAGGPEDPERLVKNIDALRGDNLRPAQRSGSTPLMNLEETVIQGIPDVGEQLSRQTNEAVEDLVQSIRRSGNTASTRDFLEAKRARLLAALDARTELAAERAAAALRGLGEPADPETIAATMRNQLETALADAKVQEGQLWATIPKDAKVPVTRTRAAARELVKNTPKAQSDDIPATVREFLSEAEGKKITKTTINEIDGLYKKLGEVATTARANNEFNKARIAEDIRAAIIRDMEGAEGAPDVVNAIKTARAFSKRLNETYRQGAVGKILQTTRSGEQRVASELTGEELMRGGIPGVKQVRELEKAAAFPATFGGESRAETALESMQEYIKQAFIASAVEDGRVNPTKARTFLGRYGETLDNFPTLKEQLKFAGDQEDVLRRVTKSGEAAKKKLQNSNVVAINRILNAPVEEEAKVLFQPRTSKRVVSEIVKTAKKDPSGEAMEGLKSGVIERIIDDMTTGQQVEVDFYRMGPAKAEAYLRGENLEKMKQIFSPKEIERLQDVVKKIRLLETSRTGRKALGMILSDTPAYLLEIPFRILGAKAGARMAGTTGGSIQSAQIGSSVAKRFLQRLSTDKAKQLVVDALRDEELFKALLLNLPKASPQARKKVTNVFRSYLLGTGNRLLEESEREDLEDEAR